MNSDREYRESMDLPMEDLTIALFGFNGDGEALEDWQIVERAVIKINMLKEMIHAAGLTEGLLKACMEN